jgi:hypothetical protein
MKDANVKYTNQHRMDWRTLRNRKQNEIEIYTRHDYRSIKRRIRRRLMKTTKYLELQNHKAVQM